MPGCCAAVFLAVGPFSFRVYIVAGVVKTIACFLAVLAGGLELFQLGLERFDLTGLLGVDLANLRANHVAKDRAIRSAFDPHHLCNLFGCAVHLFSEHGIVDT